MPTTPPGPARGQACPVVGCPSAWFALARRAVHGFRHVLCDALLDDIAQESIARLLASHGVRKPKPYVRQVARNLAVDVIRKQRREASLLADPVDDESADRLVFWLDVKRVDAMLAKAPPRHREALMDWVHGAPEALPPRHTDAPARLRAQDRSYKRRNRALRWIAERLSLAPGHRLSG